MITVTIVAIIAAVAIPSYIKSVIKGNRRAAEAALMDIAQREQQYLLDQRGYTNDLTSTGLNYAIPSNVSQYYTVTVPTTAAVMAGPPPTFTVQAAPIAGSMQASDGTLTLDNTGNKMPASLW